MSSTDQQTLDGDTTDEPAVAYWCDRCEQPHLVTDLGEHNHHEYIYESREAAESGLKPLALRGTEEEEDDDE